MSNQNYSHAEKLDLARRLYSELIDTPESRSQRRAFVAEAHEDISDFLKEVRDAELLTADDFRITITI